MDDQLRELADNLGRRDARINLGELDLALRPMTLNDMVASQQDLAELGVSEASAAGLRSQLYYCARRGGYAGTEADLADNVTELDIARVRAALSEVFPNNLQSAWARLLGLYIEIKGDPKLSAVFGPVADAIDASVEAVQRAEAGGLGESANPGTGAGSSGA